MDDTNNQRKIDLLTQALNSISIIKLDKWGYKATLESAVLIARNALDASINQTPSPH